MGSHSPLPIRSGRPPSPGRRPTRERISRLVSRPSRSFPTPPRTRTSARTMAGEASPIRPSPIKVLVCRSWSSCLHNKALASASSRRAVRQHGGIDAGQDDGSTAGPPGARRTVLSRAGRTFDCALGARLVDTGADAVLDAPDGALDLADAL